MRTATTLGKTHDGKWELIANPDVPLQEQSKNFRALFVSRSHDKFAFVQIQESDGHLRHVHLNTPAAAAAVAKRKVEERDKNKKFVDKAGKTAQEVSDERFSRARRQLDDASKPKVRPADSTAKTEAAKPKETAPPANTEADKSLINPKTGLRIDGPTLAQYVAAGYPADKYPPKGYDARDTEYAPTTPPV